MTTGRKVRRFTAGAAVLLMLGAGTALSACSDDSPDAPASPSSSVGQAPVTGAAASSSAAASTSAVPTTGAPTTGADSAPSEETRGPVAPASVILGPEDAPAGFTWKDGGAQSVDQATLQAMTQALDNLTFTPESCQAQMRRTAEASAAGAQGGAAAVYVSDADQRSAVAVTVGQKGQGDPHACDNAIATGRVDGQDMKMSIRNTDLGVDIDGAQNVTAVRTDTTFEVAGQSQTTSQSTVLGEVDGTAFTVTAQGNVDQAVLVELARKQADRIRG